jgi:ATP-dependent Clp protease ATP-binding subunit ClpA
MRASKQELVQVEKDLAGLPQKGDYDKARFLQEQKAYLKDRIQEQQSAWDEDRAQIPMVVGEDEVAQIVYSWTGIR